MNTVSVIMPTYNRAKYIKDAVESVLNQTYGDLKLIIVDDGSTDNTEQIITPYLSDSRVCYIKQPNSGSSAARNYGLSMTEGNFVAFIDSDDIWSRDKLAIQINILMALPEVDLVCSDFSAVTGADIMERSHIRSYFKVLNEYNLQYNNIFDHILEQPIDGLAQNEKVYWGNIYNTMLFGNIILTSTCLCRSAIFDSIGVFDTKYRTLEDYDLYLRISKVFRIALVTQPLIQYRYSNNQLSGENHFERLCLNLIDIFKKNVGTLDKNELLKLGSRKIQRRLGMYEAMLGYYYFNKKEMELAKRYYWKSLENNPGYFKSYFYIFFSLLPAGILQLLRRIKHIIVSRERIVKHDFQNHT